MEFHSNDRRSFLRHTSIASSALLLSPVSQLAAYHNSVDETIKIGLIGCGGRGTGAAAQAIKAHPNVKLVAMADAFKDRLDSSLENILTEVDPSKVTVSPDAQFIGFDGYKDVIPLVDVVLIATPPGFRPIHFSEAINQGKHVFMEKPVAVDAPGVRQVLQTAADAKAKKLNVVVGLQRHYQKKYIDILRMVHKGKIGDITSMQVYWNDGGVWVKEREEGESEMTYQMRNWYYFNWLCGDHIMEQHIHNLDVGNWAKQDYPISAQGMGGRQVRTDKKYGEIFDHHFVEFEYADGCIMNSQCRHIKNTFRRVDEFLTGTKGKVAFGKGIVSKHNGDVIYRHDDSNDINPYQEEHNLLFDAISRGEYRFADAENAAKSTLTALMGRLATYSGELVTTEKVMESNITLAPSHYAFDADPPVMPLADGSYQIAIPGKSVVI